MKRAELEAYPLGARLDADESPLLQDLRPVFVDLVSTLATLDDSATREQILGAFEAAVLRVNEFEEEIETVEREAILGIVYELGEIVGLETESQFAEAWRGDW